jgi:hypothetical protein
MTRGSGEDASDQRSAPLGVHGHANLIQIYVFTDAAAIFFWDRFVDRDFTRSNPSEMQARDMLPCWR